MWYPIEDDGANLIVNGEFDNTVAWTLGPTWTIAAGIASCVLDGTPANYLLEQNVPFIPGQDYTINFDCTAWNLTGTGRFECHFNDDSSFPQVCDGVGNYDWTFTAGNKVLYTGLLFDFLGGVQAGDTISIDNVTIAFLDSEIFVDYGFGDIEGTWYRSFERDAAGFVQQYANRLDRINVMFRME